MYGNSFRNSLPTKCSGCGAWRYPDDPHAEGCTLEIARAASIQRGRQRRDTAGGHKVFLLVYGLFAVAGLGAFILWLG